MTRRKPNETDTGPSDSPQVKNFVLIAPELTPVPLPLPCLTPSHANCVPESAALVRFRALSRVHLVAHIACQFLPLVTKTNGRTQSKASASFALCVFSTQTCQPLSSNLEYITLFFHTQRKIDLRLSAGYYVQQDNPSGSLLRPSRPYASHKLLLG
jgi:hypothetical protein